jgi:hypothetical protein
VALLAVTGIAVADRFGPQTASGRVLGAWVVAWCWLVVLSFALSALSQLTRAGLLAGLAAGAAAAILAARARPPAPAPSLVGGGRAFVAAFRGDAPLLVLGAACLSAAVYLGALAWFTAPTEDDSLYYHLARVAFWAQNAAIGFLDGPFDPRVTGFPILAEIGKLDAVLLGGHERWAALVQLASLGTLMVGVHSIGRSLGLERRDTAFAALLVPALPVMALQGPTSLNDLVVASFVVAAGALLLSQGRGELVLALGAVALLVASKGTAPFMLPALVALALAAQPRHRLLPLALGSAAAALVGGFWYLANLVRSGDPTGGTAGMSTSRDDSDAPVPALLAVRITRRLVDLVETSGAVGRDGLVYAVAAVGLAGIALVLAALGRRAAAGAIAIGAVLALGPLLLVELEPRLVDAHRDAWDVLGVSGVPGTEVGADQGRASPMRSAFGPVGTVLVLGALPGAILGWRRRRLPGAAVVLACAPFVVMISLAVVHWTESSDRYLAGAVCLSAATWGVLTRPLAIRAGIATVALVTLLVALWNNEDKPAGVRLLEPARATSVWARERWEQQDPRPGVGDAGRLVAQRVPEGVTVALSITPGDPTYPFFGPRLGRTVLFADVNGIPGEADWLLVSGTGDAVACPDLWAPRGAGEAGWRLYRRAAAGACEG